MRDLIERLEKMEGPSLEADSEISVAVGLHRLWKSKHGYWHVEREGANYLTLDGRDPQLKFDPTTGEKLPDEQPPVSRIYEADPDLPSYTDSVDAALSLAERVLPGWVVQHIGNDAVGNIGNMRPIGWAVELWNGKTSTQGQASTLPIALCIAILKALESKEVGHGK